MNVHGNQNRRYYETIMMNTFWDDRYDSDHFVYGKEPNSYFASEIDKLTPGNAITK